MANTLNLNLLKKKSIPNLDNSVAKNIIDIIFKITESNIRNDLEMSGLVKGFVLGKLPGVIKDSKNRIDKMNSLSVKMLLDNIQSELNKRK